jgi:hypothetical protein
MELAKFKGKKNIVVFAEVEIEADRQKVFWSKAVFRMS